VYKYCEISSGYKKIPALTNWGAREISCPSIWWGKNVAKQHGCRDQFNKSQKFSWFDFQGLVQVNFLLELMKML
jgi:hypothetical protein